MTDKLWAIVYSEHRRQTATLFEFFQSADHTKCWQTGISLYLEHFPVVIVDHVQEAKGAAIPQAVMHVIQAPDLVAFEYREAYRLRFARGMVLPPDELTKGYTFVSPNLTPHDETGIIASWSEEDFVRRFRTGKRIDTSPMPWGSFSRMDDVELKALYRYLRSLEPVDNEVLQIVFAPEEEVPQQ